MRMWWKCEGFGHYCWDLHAWICRCSYVFWRVQACINIPQTDSSLMSQPFFSLHNQLWQSTLIFAHKDSRGWLLDLYFHPSLLQIIGYPGTPASHYSLPFPVSCRHLSCSPLLQSPNNIQKQAREQHTAITEMSITKRHSIKHLRPSSPVREEIYSKHGPWEISLHAEN